MGDLYCSRCRAKAQGATFEEADAKIDHSRGLSIGRPCSGDSNFLVWTEKTDTPPKEKVEIAATVATTKSKNETKPRSKK